MHAYEILFSPTGGTAKVAAALTTDWPSVKTIDLSIPSTHYEDICLESDSLAVIAMPAFGGAAPQLALDRLSRIRGNGALLNMSWNMISCLLWINGCCPA